MIPTSPAYPSNQKFSVRSLIALFILKTRGDLTYVRSFLVLPFCFIFANAWMTVIAPIGYVFSEIKTVNTVETLFSCISATQPLQNFRFEITRLDNAFFHFHQLKCSLVTSGPLKKKKTRNICEILNESLFS